MLLLDETDPQVFGVLVDHHLHIETLLFLRGVGYDLMLCGGRHLRPELQQSLAERLIKEPQQRDQSD